ncbi:peptidase inhibitor family I36 protein [Actinomadura sp. ATCC 31491]|uniref:Peptidase inhibitor family I36 protein n=1 Tax=Actinomadura luzonensis TaxID=2805427 RepID=A0ABT0G2Q8_9ACTN|nr:peptidase inhibitor family I36 protein [Actinomadura luzonensis]MCK2218789.1 peptidase inhibitor family I36 protein [Actinomadura luzonensis]
MRTTHVTRIAAASAAALAALTLCSAPAAAAARAGDICLYSGRNYTGASWCWNPGNGYVDVPPALHDNVASFRAGANGCFINWIQVPNRKETRVVRDGDYRSVYDNDFGGKIDAVAPTC